MFGTVRKSVSFIFVLAMLTLMSAGAFAKGDVKSGGDTGRNPVLGVNFVGGWGGYWGGELEVDLKLGKSMSIAPRIGGAGFNSLDIGASLRFAIIDGKRPHGFWVGPSLDIIFAGNNKWGGTSTGVYIVPAGEFGWRYTFDFGLSLQPFIRVGAFINSGFWLYGTGGWGIGYAF